MLQPKAAWLADGYRPASPDQLVSADNIDDYALLPDEDHKTFVKLKISNPSCLTNQQRRVKSATARITTTPEGGDAYYDGQLSPHCYIPQRPASSLAIRASPHTNYKSMIGKKMRRIKSAGSIRSQTPSRSKFAIVNRLYEDEARRATVNFHPHPDSRYASRHSRCFGASPRQTDFVLPRPHSALELNSERCLINRPGSAASFLNSKFAWEAEPSQQTQRYIDCHRPTTSPSVVPRQDHQNVRIFKQNYILRGMVPHFCNFVRQVQLHSKDDGAGMLPVPPTPIIKEPDSDEDEGIGLITESQDESYTGHWRLGELGEPGIEGRPSTPCPSTDDPNERRENDDRSAQWNESTGDDQSKKTASKSSGSHEQESDRGLSLKIQSQLDDPIESENKTIIKIPTTNKDVSTESKTTLSDSLKDLFPTLLKQPPPNKSKSNSGKQKPPSNTTRRRRSCSSKKEKKGSERVRKKKTDQKDQRMEESTLPIKIESDITTSVNSLGSDALDVKPDIKVPDLPTYKTEEKVGEKRPGRKPSRHKIETPPKVSQTSFLTSKQEQLEFEMKSRKLYEYTPAEPIVQEEVHLKKSKVQSWDKVRMALSQQSSRFELPMDMKVLEKMTPQEYLKQYCVISSRRTNLYQKIFQRHKDKFGKLIAYKDLGKALKDVLVNTITQEKIREVCEMLEIDENSEIDYKLFSGVAALSERLLYSSFVTEDTIDMVEYQREKIECADFCALDWKFHGIDVNPPVRKLLKALS